MAKENMHDVDLLLRIKPTANDLFYPIMPTLEERVENTSEEENRKREIRNERRKVDWENECKQIRSRGPMIDRYTWDEADLKVKSLTYLSLGTEATRIFHQRNPHTIIDRCSTNELVYKLGLTFTRPRNLTFDRFQLITVQQLPNESLETFFSRLRELGSKAALGNVEEDLIKDFFIAKMNNTTIQMELLSEVRTAAQVLNFALSRERGQENQKEILRSSAPNWNNQVNAITNKYARSTPRPKQQNPQQSNKTNEQCWRCGGNFTAGHMNQCTAKQAICNICKKTGHFAKMCRSKIPPLPAQRHNQRSPAQRPQGQNSQLKVRQIQEQLIDEDEEEEQEVVSVDPESALYIKELSEDWADINHIAPESFSKVQNVQLNTTMPNEIWVETTTKNLKIQWLADTGSPRSFVTLDQANKIMEHIPEVKLQQYTSQTKYKCFNNNNIKIEGELIINLQSGSWTAQNCQILVVGHKTHYLMGRDVLQKLGISLQQKPKNSPGNKINSISEIETEKNIIKWIFNKYPHLCTRLGKSKNHIAKSIFKQNHAPIQQKGRRVPLHLLEKIERELDKLIQDKQITKLEKCPDDRFVSPVVITVKKDKSVKIALDSKKLNKAIHKNKYQMQSIDHLVDAVALYITQRKDSPGTFWFSKIDLKYAYSQIPLDDSIAKHCNFSILGGKATGTYRFINGFYGLTDMPATFQKTIDKTLEGIHSKFAFLDDILVITKGSIREHEKELDKILKRLDNEGLAINLQKCEFAKHTIEWIGFTITPTGITPLVTKTEAITKLDNPKTLKQLRSFLGSVHHLTKFIPNLAKLSEPLRPLLKKNPEAKNNKLDWKEEHSAAFNDIKFKIHQIIENKHFDTNKQTRVKCDASAKGLGACIEQKHGKEWHTIAFASRFLNTHESRYSTNELELLAVVWSLEHFKHYLFGTEFTLQTDHRALLTALNENRGNKTYQSRLTRWVDRLLPFNFNLEHIPGKNMGFADYLSRNPKNNPPPPSSDDTKFIVNLINDFKFVLTQNSINCTSATRTPTDKYQTKQLNTNSNPLSNNYDNAFCLNHSNFQPPSLFNSNPHTLIPINT